MRDLDESTPDHGAPASSLRHDVARISLWALVVAMGIQLGGGLYEHTSAVPQWSAAPGDALPDALLRSAQAHAATAFWPLVSPCAAVLALVNLFAARHARGRVRLWWFMAAALELVNQAVTYLYFAPELRLFVAGELAPLSLEQRALAWVRLDTARIVFEAFAWSLALAALARWRSAEAPADRDETVAIPPAPSS